MLRASLINWLLVLVVLKLGALNVHLGSVVGSQDIEREALLKFKQSLISDNNRLSSWEGSDYCRWEGVGCDSVTSHVNRLDLHYSCQYIPPPDGQYMGNNFSIAAVDDYGEPSLSMVAPNLDHSLVELSWLNYLDLSCNDFQGSQIPEFIGSFKHLKYLNLSNSNFSGLVPSQIQNLTKLHTLDLSMPWYHVGKMLSSDLEWVPRLVSLRYLNMGGNAISRPTNSKHVLDMPPLLGLQLSNCQLTVPIFYRLFSNLTSLSTIQLLDLSYNSLEGLPLRVFVHMKRLRYLDLSSNMLEGPIPHEFANMTSLTYLGLAMNNFNGSIPLWIRNLENLRNIDLYYNYFSGVEGGTIMGILGHLCKLKSFDLSYNSVVGKIGSHRNLSKCVTYDLERLQLGFNTIGGTLPSWLGDFKNLRFLGIYSNVIHGRIPVSIGNLSYLEELDLFQNNLTGTLPDSMRNMRNLRVINLGNNKITGDIAISFEHLSLLENLDLSQNGLSGTIPVTLGQCKSLVAIDLSSNNLHGVVSESHFAKLSSLEFLDLSFNSLEVNLSSTWSPTFQLKSLTFKSCKMQTRFPQWIAKQTKLTVLDLSDNMMSGTLDSLLPLGSLNLVNVSHNQLTGALPYFSSSSVVSIDLSYNLLSGPLIRSDRGLIGASICRLPNLSFLDLQRNHISGNISDCWGYSNPLEYINLSSNNLSEIIPKSMGVLPNLAFLKLSNNSFRGSIPVTLTTNPKLQILDLGDNKLVGDIPNTWQSQSFPLLQMLRLRGNRLVGVIPTTLCAFPLLQFIDFSENKLTGSIPRCFGNLTGMNPSPLLYRSVSNFTDPRDDTTTVVLKGAELQYSTTLEFVVNLDLSCNALVGSIPEEITKLLGLIGLNLSYNHLRGSIPNMIGKMRSLESLDLSNNHLNGTIPSSVSNLTSLISLNLSYNNLSGQIPTGQQLQVIDNPTKAYVGNPRLCGDPLPNKCNNNHGQIQPNKEEEERGKGYDVETPLFYLVVVSGFATGFWGVIGSLLLKNRYKFALFQLVNNVADYLFVQAMVGLNKLRN